MADELWTTWPTNTAGADTRSALTEEYRDYGAWARHYSTVRMTLGTFFLSAATGVIYLRWDRPECMLGALALLILAIGAFLFLSFSWLTFRATNRQLRIVAAYRTALGSQARAPAQQAEFWRWDGAYLCFILVFLFLLFEAWWMWGRPGAVKIIESKIPITVQVGDAPAVSVKVPVTVTAPIRNER